MPGLPWAMGPPPATASVLGPLLTPLVHGSDDAVFATEQGAFRPIKAANHELDGDGHSTGRGWEAVASRQPGMVLFGCEEKGGVLPGVWTRRGKSGRVCKRRPRALNREGMRSGKPRAEP